MKSKKADHILVQQEDKIQLVTLNRSHKLHALSSPDPLALQFALDAIASNEGIRAVIIAGAGDRAFCADMDVSEFEDHTSAQAHAFIRQLKGVCDRLRRLPQVVIAGINGHCIGGAPKMAMAAHLFDAASADSNNHVALAFASDVPPSCWQRIGAGRPHASRTVEHARKFQDH